MYNLDLAILGLEHFVEHFRTPALFTPNQFHFKPEVDWHRTFQHQSHSKVVLCLVQDCLPN